MFVLCASDGLYIGGWGGESAAAPTGKSFRFVRACERAGGRARGARSANGYLEGFARRTSSSSSSPRGGLFQNGSVLAAVLRFSLPK